MAFTKINAAGIGTTETVTVDGLTVINNESIGGNLTVTGNATISGVLTYEDVTNVDSVGLITARNGVVVGSGITLSKDGDIFATGVTTSTTFSGNFSGGTVSGTTGTFSSDVKSTAGIVDIRSGSSINTNVTGGAASGTLQKNTTSGEFAIVSGGSGGNNYLNFYTSASAAPTAKLRITHTGQLLHGHSASIGLGRDFETSSTSGYGGISINRFSADTGSGGLDFVKSRNASLGGNTIVQSDDNVGAITWRGADGTDFATPAAQIKVAVDGTPGSNDMPGRIMFSTTADGASSVTERLRISSSGQVRINTAGAPSADLHVGGTGGALNVLFQTSRSSGAYHKYALGASGADLGYIGSAQQISSSGVASGFAFRSESHIEFCSGGSTERIRIDSLGRLFINKTTNRDKYFNGTYTGKLQVEGTDDTTRLTQFIHNSANASQHIFVLGKSRGGVGSYTIVQDGDYLGTISFQGADGDEMVDGARIEAQVNGTPNNDSMPTDLLFKTNTGGASPTERLRIREDGKCFFGNDTSNQDSNRYVFVGTKAFSGGIVQGQLAIADNNAYNFSNNGGGIAFQAKYSSGGAYTQMAAIEGRKSNNTDGHYGGVLNFSTRTHNGNLTQAMYITADQAAYMREALYVGNEFNMQSFDAVARDKYFDAGYLNNALYIRRTNGGDGGHAVQMTIASSGVISGDFNDTSDAKLKKNVETIADGAIEDIKKLRPVTFDWIDDTRNNNISGFIAQEVKEVLPNLVEGTEYDPTLNDEEAGTKGGIKSEGYSIHSVGVTAHLTKAVQELIAEVETLKAKVAALEG